MVIGRVPLNLGCITERAEVRDGLAHVHITRADGSKGKLTADHVIAATGYRVSIARLTMLSESIRATIKSVKGDPVLSSTFESSVPGLYFVGLAAANSLVR
jgi:pyruvate/2-oxoglutarate dehydrogenase complex dihydrolipoamide dehydrogenase (E3) component